MERIVFKYEKMFSIQFSHPRYPNDASSGGVLGSQIFLQPDEVTKKLFKTHDIHYRMVHDQLLCFVRVRVDADIPFFRLPNVLSARFFLVLKEELVRHTEVDDLHGNESMYRFRINLRASTDEMDLAGATLGTVVSRDPSLEFIAGDPGTWVTTYSNLKGQFGVIDIVTEGSSTHRLYTDVANQVLSYTPANGREHEHLFTIHFNN